MRGQPVPPPPRTRAQRKAMEHHAMATEPCPPCERGEHAECWGVEPPLSVPALRCPCTHLEHVEVG